MEFFNCCVVRSIQYCKRALNIFSVFWWERDLLVSSGALKSDPALIEKVEGIMDFELLKGYLSLMNPIHIPLLFISSKISLDENSTREQAQGVVIFGEYVSSHGPSCTFVAQR